jgi:hypothetical protein
MAQVSRPGPLTRRRFIAGAAGVAGAGAAAAVAGAQLLGESASSLRAAEPLALALALERLQAAFYADALGNGALSGELLDFATVAAEHEAAHVDLIAPLVTDPPDEPAYDFGGDTRRPAAFAGAAASLEDLAVAAYNGILPGLTDPALAVAGGIASVDARHAAWVRAIAGRDPAAIATDPGIGAAAAVDRIEATGYLVERGP